MAELPAAETGPSALDFLDDPARALAEAARVSRHGLMPLALNRWSRGGLSRRTGPQASQPILGRARDVSFPSVRIALRRAVGERLQHLHWHHGCYPRDMWPTPSRLPAGDVVAVAAVLK